MNVLAVQGPDGWTLVDTGTGGSPKRIQAGLDSLGVAPGQLARIYLTHHHPDHVGGLKAMRAWAPGAEIVASEHEAEIISGRRPIDRSANPVFGRLQGMMRIPVVAVDRTVKAGDAVGPLTVVATPGHTLGHTSLFDPGNRLLFTADAIGALPRKLRVGVRRFLCADPALARRSVAELLELDFDTVAFAHGPVIREGAKERLRTILAACSY